MPRDASMRAGDALLLLTCVARSSWNGSLQSHASSDEVAREWNELTGDQVRAQVMGGRLAKLARAGLLERQQTTDHFAMWRCSRNVREIVNAIDSNQAASSVPVV